jgi:hypothetical protein
VVIPLQDGGIWPIGYQRSCEGGSLPIAFEGPTVTEATRRRTEMTERAMKPVKVSEIEILGLYGNASASDALALKVGKPGELGHYRPCLDDGSRSDATND